MTQKIIICGFPHSGTSILKSVLGHIPDIEEIIGETELINKDTELPFILCKWPFTKSYYFSNKYEYYIKIFIIRNPVFVFSSLNKRFDYDIPNCHSIMKYIKTIKKFLKYRNGHINTYTIKYEDMFDNNFHALRIILNTIGIKYDNNIFNNTEYTNLIQQGIEIKSEKPSNETHALYRTWQINQPFISNNDESKIDLTEMQIVHIINDDNILELYPNISNNIW